MKEFTFKYNTGKGGVYFLAVFFGVPFGIFLPSFILMEYVPWVLWVSIPLGIGIIAYCVRKFIKEINSTDTIQVDDLGFTSNDYGRISYRDIHSIPPYGALQAPPPSMRIKLHNGKKLVWIFNPQSPKSQEDIAIFTAFREALLDHLKRQTQTAIAETQEQAVKPENITAPPADVIEQLEKHKKDRNFIYCSIKSDSAGAD